jgi:DNA invertase Pin-like site-specific DNA recombinase
MVTDKIKELEAARAKLATLEQSIADELNKELATLPARYGFASTADFVRAVNGAAGRGNGRRGRRGRKPGASAGAASAGSGSKRRKRAVITEETRGQVKKMVNDGKTGAEIAKAVGISLPSVQNIKKALGLVKKR